MFPPSKTLAVVVPNGAQTPLKPDVVKYQQSVADVFHKLGLIPKPIKVKDVVLNKKL